MRKVVVLSIVPVPEPPANPIIIPALFVYTGESIEAEAVRSLGNP